MKKLMFLAVFCLTACGMVTLFSCSSQAPQANLKSDIDSLSYAYGVRATEGLDGYLQQMGITGVAKEEFFKNFLITSKIDKKDTASINRVTENLNRIKATLLGQQIGMQVSNGMFSQANEDVFGSDSTQSLNKSQYLAGFLAASQDKKLLMKKEDAQVYAQTKAAEIQAKINAPIKEKNQAFLDKNKSEAGVVTTASGLQYKVVKEGSGVKPAMGDTVLVNYKLADIDGKQLQSNDSIKFVIGSVIPGWNEGIPLMTPGSKYTFYIPYNLGYGEQGRRPDIGPYATLIFDVDLLKVHPKKAGAAAPAVAPRQQIQIMPGKK